MKRTIQITVITLVRQIVHKPLGNKLHEAMKVVDV